MWYFLIFILLPKFQKLCYEKVIHVYGVCIIQVINTNSSTVLDFSPHFFQQLAAARTETEGIVDNTAARKSKEPYLVNLNEDAMLSGVLCHFLSPKETTVGRKDAKPVPTICLSGLRYSTEILSVLR